MAKAQAGAVAIQQALVKYFKFSYRRAADLCGVSPRTVWEHVAARPGANVAGWNSRPAEIRRQAIAAAKKLIDDNKPSLTHQG